MSDEPLDSQLKTCSDVNKFFDILTKYVDFPISIQLQNILKLNTYDSSIALSRFNESSIEEIEDFMRNDFASTMISPNEPMINYLGHFTNDQKKFKLLSGQRRVLTVIAERCHALYETNIVPQASEIILQNSVRANQQVLSFQDQRDATDNDASSLFNVIGSRMITVFNDAKRITLSAWSWPSRHVASKIAHNFEVNGNLMHNDLLNINLQYLTPHNHAEFMDSIVKSDLENVKLSLQQSLAVSVRFDGSVDRTQKHNLYVMVHIVKSDATTSTVFIGFDVPVSGNAEDYVQCLKKLTKVILPWDIFFALITSIVTDGENLNTGRLNGMWAKLKQERSELIPPQLPLFTIWCVAHRINLAWKSVCSIRIIAISIRHCIQLSTYFRKSGNRTKKLENIAKTNELKPPLHYPSFFDVRWTEYVSNLINVVLRNWRTVMTYLEFHNLTSIKHVWCLYDRLHILTFLADILGLVKKFQKKCQSDNISVLDILPLKDKLIQDLNNCKDACLTEGWEELFLSKVINNGKNQIFFGIKLIKNVTRRRTHLITRATRARKLAATSRNSTATRRNSTAPRRNSTATSNNVSQSVFSFTSRNRHEIIRSLINQLNLRLNLDTSLQRTLQPFAKISSSVSEYDLKLCFSFIVPDLDENTFLSEYYMSAGLLKNLNCDTPLDSLQMLHKISPNNLYTTKIALARIIAAKPHSADVERLISVYNKFKSTDRTSLSPKTLWNYLYINTNMGCVEDFDPTSAVRHWMNEKQRRPKRSETRRQQEWFHGVFKEGGSVHRGNHPIIEF